MKAKPVDATSWNTPRWLFDFLNEKYRFTLDAAASHANAKCPLHFTKYEDAFVMPWKGRVWCNPPYGSKPSTAEWVERGFEQAKTVSELACLLIPLKPDTDMYHERVRLGQLVQEERFTDPRGKLGIYQKRKAWEHGLQVETWEFRQRIAFTDDSGNVAGNGWFASVAVVYKSL